MCIFWRGAGAIRVKYMGQGLRDAIRVSKTTCGRMQTEIMQTAVSEETEVRAQGFRFRVP